MQYLLWSTSYSQYCSTKSRTALRLAESRNVCTHAKACFFFFLFFFCGFSMPDYWLLCIDMYLIYHTHTHTLARWCFSTSVFPKMWKAFLYSRMSHFMFGWQSLILFCDDAYCSVWCKSTFQLDAIFFFFFFLKQYHHPKVSPSNPASHGRSSELSQAALRWLRKGCHEFNFRFSPPANQTCVLVQCFCLWLEKKKQNKTVHCLEDCLACGTFF